MDVECAVLLTKNMSIFAEVTLLVLTFALFLQFASQLLNTHHDDFFLCGGFSSVAGYLLCTITGDQS